ncbi:MAG: hypothetical protein WCA35_04410 [Kovacikia sp.]
MIELDIVSNSTIKVIAQIVVIAINWMNLFYDGVMAGAMAATFRGGDGWGLN